MTQNEARTLSRLMKEPMRNIFTGDKCGCFPSSFLSGSEYYLY